METKRKVLALFTFATTVAASLLVGGPAHAATPADVCGPATYPGNMCYFYESNYRGSQGGFLGNRPDLLDYTFVTSGAGQGQVIGNNAGSGHNRDTVCRVRIYYDVNYTGVYLELGPNRSHPTLGVVNNDNRSHLFLC